MKKLIALMLALVMVFCLVSCGGDDKTTTDGGSTGDTTTPSDTSDTTGDTTTPPADDGTAGDGTGEDAGTVEPAPVEPEALPETPLNYWSFEDTTGLTAVFQDVKADDSPNDGATYDLNPSVHEIMLADGGPVGKALYLDGKYGVRLDNLVPPTDDTYTVSFWYNASRLSNFTPSVTMGRNPGHDAANTTVSWFNVTRGSWDETLYPIVWNRNSSVSADQIDGGVWPWTGALDGQTVGKKEWALLTFVVDGGRYQYVDEATNAPMGERVGCQFYLNGELKFDANAENKYYQGFAPEIFMGDGVEGYIGINFWDTLYKGFIDELYVYDEALTPGQVLSLYQQGTVPASTEEPTYDGPVDGDGSEPEEPAAPVLPEIAADPSAIDALGTVARDAGFWSDTSDGFEVADGATVTMKLNNYSDLANNWDNFVLAFTNTAVTTDKVASADNFEGYKEYAVVRADAYGWGDEAYSGAFETSWGDDWAGWLNLMGDAEVTAVITREGGDITLNMTFVGADGTTMTEGALVKSTLTADDPCYVHVTTDHAYVEILAVA